MKVLLPTGKTAPVRRWVGSIWGDVPWESSGRRVQRFTVQSSEVAGFGLRVIGATTH